VYISLEEHQLPLHPGMYARVAIRTSASQGIVVPVTAVLIKDGERDIVYVENSDGTFVPRDVVVTQSIDGHVQVTSGLTPGERIVVRGALLLDQAAGQLL
jgi:membrane fusion protein, heavy metal efflux system